MDSFGHFEWVLFGLLLFFALLLFLSGIYLATRSKWLFNAVAGTGLHPSTLRVVFSKDLSGCRTVTTLSNGQRAQFYRLWVRPSAHLNNIRCSGTLVDIMAPMPGMRGDWYSFWPAERLQLAWATHTDPPQVFIDLRDEHGRYLDVFFVTERGEVGFGTPHFTVANSLATLNFVPGSPYLFVVSLVSDGEEPEEIAIKLIWPTDWQNVDVRDARKEIQNFPRKIPQPRRSP